MSTEMYLAPVPIKEIEVSDRAREDFGNLLELKQSILENGLITPIAVQELDGHYRLLAGERRLRACTELQWEMIDAKVFKGEIGEYELFSIELAENVDRKDFTWQEKVRLEAKIHQRQVAFHGAKVSPTGRGWSQTDTAKFLGAAKSVVTQDLKLASAMEKMPELGTCKTKEEATKLLRTIQEQAIHEELLKRASTAAVSTSSPSQAVEQAERQLKMVNAYILGDALELLKTVPDESMDFIELDPPYGIDLPGQKKEGANTEEYQEVDDHAYYCFIGTVLDECVRILKPMRWVVLWHGYHHTMVLRGMLEQRGLTCPSMPAIWAKPSGQTTRPERSMASSYELFHYAAKGNAILMRQGRANVFYSSPVPPQRKIHPTEKPVELLKMILQTFCIEGYQVLSPFLGSGVTLMAAANLNMDATGFDLSSVYKKSYEIRILSQEYGKYFNTVEKSE